MELVKKLIEETQGLKTQYVEKTMDWAKEQYQRNIERRDLFRKMTFRQKSADRNPELILVSQSKYYQEEKWVWNTVFFSSQDEFVSKMADNAEKHYHSSIEKLALRIQKKGLNENNLKFVTAHVGVNIETTITDGNKTVRAFTVLAYGPIQRPHYRYLIK